MVRRLFERKMKTKLYIIIGMIIAIIISVSALIIIDNIERAPYHPSYLEPQVIFEDFNEEDDSLEKILDNCYAQKNNLPHHQPLLRLSNGTHFINNNTCEWKLVEKDPNPTQLGGPIIVDDLYVENNSFNLHGLRDFNPPYNELQIALEYCSGKFGIIPESKTLWIDETHKITSNSCELEKRTNSGITLDRTVYTTPFGYPRDTTGNYDYCFSYKTDPEYGVEIQNSTHILNIENCEWK